MNTNDRGMNLAELVRMGTEVVRGPDGKTYPLHRGHPDPRCACAGTGYVHDAGQVHPCPEHLLGSRDPRGEAPTVDWEAVAGRALADLQATTNELKRLKALTEDDPNCVYHELRAALDENERMRREAPADWLRAYDRRHHGGS